MAYQTEQRKLLTAFFRAHPSESFTAKEIFAQLSGTDISLSAIYRNLAAMAKNGTVCCSTRTDSHESAYRLAQQSCCDTIHMSCIDCGEMFHMDRQVAELVQNSLAASNAFCLNKSKTILYGTCRRCMAAHHR